MKNKDKFFQSKLTTLIFSLISALILWFIVATTNESIITHTIKDVPIQIDYNASIYKSLGLDIIDISQDTVDVEVKGDRAIVMSLDKDDVVVYPEISGNITGAGKYELYLYYQKVDLSAGFTVTTTSPRMVSVLFDATETKQIPVSADVSNVEIAEGYILGTPVVTPSEVTVTGPVSETSRIAEIKTYVVIEEPINQRTIQTNKVVLLDKDGEELALEHVVLSTEMVETSLPVLKRAEVPLRVEYTNVPKGFDISTLNFKLSNDTITVAGPEADATAMGESGYVVGYIDLQTFEYGEPQRFDVELPDSFLNLDNIISVEANLDSTDLSTKSLTVNDIRVINNTSNYDIDVETKNIYNVMLIGPEESLDVLKVGSVIAEIDASEITFAKGQQNVPVNIIVPSNTDVFASGSYTALINISTKQ